MGSLLWKLELRRIIMKIQSKMNTIDSSFFNHPVVSFNGMIRPTHTVKDIIVRNSMFLNEHSVSVNQQPSLAAEEEDPLINR